MYIPRIINFRIKLKIRLTVLDLWDLAYEFLLLLVLNRSESVPISSWPHCLQDFVSSKENMNDQNLNMYI